MNFDLTPLKRRLLKRTGEEDSVWPCLALTLYSERAFPAIGPAAANALRSYMASIPAGVMRSCLSEDEVRPLGAQRMARDLKRLESPPKGDDGLTLVYSSSLTGAPSDFGLHFALLDLDDEDLVGPAEANVLRFEWPWTTANGDGCERFFERVVPLIEQVPCDSATAGFGFSYWQEDRFAADQVQALLARYLGFDHSDMNCNNMRGRAPGANWITYVNASLAEKLDRTTTLGSSMPSTAVVNTKLGRLIRASRRPPVGDSNRESRDIGCLPTVSRWLRPLRVSIDGFSGTRETVSASSWISRFDNRQDELWDNLP